MAAIGESKVPQLPAVRPKIATNAGSSEYGRITSGIPTPTVITAKAAKEFPIIAVKKVMAAKYTIPARNG